MAPGRVWIRFRIGATVAGLVLAASLSAPLAGMQDPMRTVQVPRVLVPRVAAPDVVVPQAAVPRPAPVMTPGSPPQPPVQVPLPDPETMGWRRLTPQRAEAFVEAARRGLNYLPGEVLVKFKDGMGPIDQNRALAALRSRPTADSLDWRGEVAIVRDDSQPNAYVMADQLRGQPEVEFAEPNYIAKVDPFERSTLALPASSRPAAVRQYRGGGRVQAVPNDSDYAGYQWNFSLIAMPGAWDIQPGGRTDLIAAVIDTGVTGAAMTMNTPLWTGSSFQNVALPFTVNPDLPASRHVLPRDYVFVSPSGGAVDTDGHGSHVSGTLAEATNNALQSAGMAYNIKIMPVKVCASYWDIMIERGLAGIPGFIPIDSGGCPFSDIADGVRYAVDNGARVMNISIGGPSQSSTMQSALAYAAGKGAFISISMGNDFEDGNAISYPAGYAPGIAGVMSVAAIGPNQVKSYYSSTGSHCEISAPGGDARSGSGRVDLGRIWQSTLRPTDVLETLTVPRFDRYATVGYQGTSMAAPHVAGLAALLMSQVPSLTGAQVESIIKGSAKNIGDANSYGAGLIQPRAALFGQGIRK